MRDLFIARSREKEKHTKVKQAIILIVRQFGRYDRGINSNLLRILLKPLVH
jgi:hypothetical protein